MRRRRASQPLAAWVRYCRWVGDRGHGGGYPGQSSTAIGLIDINRIENGKLVERWGQTDLIGLMRQIGAIPAPEQGA